MVSQAFWELTLLTFPFHNNSRLCNPNPNPTFRGTLCSNHTAFLCGQKSTYLIPARPVLCLMSRLLTNVYSGLSLGSLSWLPKLGPCSYVNYLPFFPRSSETKTSVFCAILLHASKNTWGFLGLVFATLDLSVRGRIVLIWVVRTELF